MEPVLGSYLDQIKRPEIEWDVTALAFEICRILKPRGEFSAHYEFLNDIERRIRSAGGDSTDVYAKIETINRVLFREEGFSGNREQFDDHLNSYLSYVIANRRGIPITLCILYREVARRVGLALEWIGMPGHFLLGLRTPTQRLFLDPFNTGRLLLSRECLSLMTELMGPGFPAKEEHLLPVSPRTVLLRLLLNLKLVYRQSKNDSLLLEVIERRIPLLDDPVTEILERGLARINLDNLKAGLIDIEYFLEHSKDDAMKKLLAGQLEHLRRVAKGN